MANKVLYIIAISAAAIGAGILWLYRSNAGPLQVDAASPVQELQSRVAVKSQEHPQVSRSEEAGRSDVVARHAAAETGIDTQLQLDRETSTTRSGEVNPTSKMDGLSVAEGAAFPISESIKAE